MKTILNHEVTIEGTGDGLAIMLDGADAIMVTPVKRNTDTTKEWTLDDTDGEPLYQTAAEPRLYAAVVNALRAAFDIPLTPEEEEEERARVHQLIHGVTR